MTNAVAGDRTQKGSLVKIRSRNSMDIDSGNTGDLLWGCMRYCECCSLQMI